jgi:hypothetical protein
VIAALAGCSAGAGGHPSVPAKPAAVTSAAQPAGGTSRAPAQDATAVAPLTGQAVTPAAAQSARAIGTGPATVFSAASAGTAAPRGSGGTAAAGTWVKPGLSTVTNYLDASGVPMDFAPGPTWIMLTPAGTRIIPAGG